MGAARNPQAHYNIAPTDTVDVVTPAHDGGDHSCRCAGDSFHGGGKRPSRTSRQPLTPAWRRSSINPCSATPSGVIDASFRRQVIANGERCTMAGQPYFISTADGGVLIMAGLWTDGPSRDRRAGDILSDRRHRRERLDPPHS